MLFTNEELEQINYIILNYPDNYWNWCIDIFPDSRPKLKRYIQLVREIIKRKNAYMKIYNWIYRRLWIYKYMKFIEIIEKKRMHPNSNYLKLIVNNFDN